MAVSWDCAQLSCVGGREINEDSTACVLTPQGLMVVVADGLGGHGHGEVASRSLTDTFSREFSSYAGNDSALFLSSAFDTAQNEILRMQQERSSPNDMKTTVAALVILADTVRWAHCGDTRLYYFNKNRLKTRTLDHSVPQMLVLSGEIKEKHIPHHPDRNKLLRVVGVPWDSPRYQIGEPVAVSADSAFLLCTDGFWEHITHKTMIKCLKKTKNAQEWLDLMKSEVERAATNADMDNYTASAIRAVAG